MLTCPACGRANPVEASFCMGCGGPLGATATAREVRKTVTALFCDLVGSTALGELHDPEVLRPLLHAYFAEMRVAVERHGGRVEKFIGDAVSAVFGLPVSHEDDGLRAVRAGMEMTERLAALNQRSSIPLRCRIGVTTGEVLVPAGGEPLIGDTMNTAARLQSSAEPGSVIIGEPTWQLVRDAITAEPAAPLALKGKAAPVPSYRVLRVASRSPMRTRRLDAPMVGRIREATLLAQAHERSVADRACQLFTVLGTAGAGKSRLVEEFLRTLAGTEAEVLRGRCLPYGDGITWYPVTEALRGTLGLADFADAPTVREAIHVAVGDEEHASSIEANLARIFAAGEGGSPEETFWAIRRLLETLGRRHPVVLVLDDIHWGEPTFLDFVEHVADWSRDASILLLCMARLDLLDERPAWGGGKTNATTISLAPLSEAECGRLIVGLLGSAALPAIARDRITAVAEGNPLFVEEMLRMLVDDGRLVRDVATGDWRAAGDLGDLAVPPTIAALLSARLDRLSDPERTVVEAAAVEGKGFHPGAVAALLPEAARPDLAHHLRSLVRRELVAPERSSLRGEDAYRFHHQLIRDAAYDAIPKTERSTLHARFADWLEAVAGDRAIEQEAIVGHHLATAHAYRVELGLPEDRDLRLRAAKAMGAAGARALDAGDVRAAIELLGPAADLAAGDRAELDLLSRLMSALSDAAEYEPADAVAERLAVAAAAVGDPVYQVRVHLYRSYLDLDLSPEAHQRLADEAVHTFREHGAHGLVPLALIRTWAIELRRGRIARMLELGTEAFVETRDGGDRRWVTLCLMWTMAALEYGPPPLSEGLGLADAHLATFHKERAIVGGLLPERAMIAAWLGRTDEARADLAAGRAIQRELGSRSDEWYYDMVDGCIAWAEGDPARALDRFREANRWVVEHEDSVTAGYLGPPLARVLLELGRDDEAEAIVRGFRDNIHYPMAGVAAPSITAVIAARRGDVDTALRLSAEAEARAAVTDLPIEQAYVALERAEILSLAGRHAEARAAAQDALARFERKEYVIGIRRARELLATMLA